MAPVRLMQDDPGGDWTLPGVYEAGPGLYRIPLPLPNDGLRAVNVYAVRDGDGLVMVDSGWALAGARELLEQAVKVLGYELAETRRFLVTHVHRDHYTMAVALRREFGTRVTLGRGEARTLQLAREAVPYSGLATQLRRGGAAELAATLQAERRASADAANWADPDDWLDAPDDIELETATWQAYPTPGHTRGHVVFVDGGRNVMFAGDHVLPRITPSIGVERNSAELPLRDYLDSLALVRGLPDRRLLPAHGPVGPSVHARVDELIDHHNTRLARIQETVEAHPGTAAEMARRIRWTRRERWFDELDLFSKCLAVSETLAHLDVLAAAGRLRWTDSDEGAYYSKA
jgi:glyoxylase-like metal-dependent hydrolase (beta-lactamase superfamily II)